MNSKTLSDTVNVSIEAAGGTVIWIVAPDGIRLRVSHWPEGVRGTILLLNGRTEYIEKHLETVAEIQSRGFAVWSLDWRGQGLSTRLLSDPLRHHVADFDDYLDDIDLLLNQHVVPLLQGRPLVLIGCSMGGHLGARILARRAQLFSRGILCAPMIDFLRGGSAVRAFIRGVLQLVCLCPGQAKRFGPGVRAQPNLTRPFEGNALTTCHRRFAVDLALLQSMPAVHVGGCTWGWLRAATTSIAVLLRSATIRQINMPVLVIQAGAERVVDNKAMRQFALRLPRGDFLALPGAAHELFREHDRHRQPFWAAIDRFLEPIR